MEVIGWRLRSSNSVVRSSYDKPDRYWFGSKPRLLLDIRGQRAQALIGEVKSVVGKYPWANEYSVFPGPNSNTYVARILNQVPGLHAELSHNSVGKDYTSSVSAGWTQAGDGLRLDVPMLGASLGWQQGIELHLIGLTAGISFWPPALKLPILPRIGFEPGQTRTP